MPWVEVPCQGKEGGIAEKSSQSTITLSSGICPFFGATFGVADATFRVAFWIKGTVSKQPNGSLLIVLIEVGRQLDNLLASGIFIGVSV